MSNEFKTAREAWRFIDNDGVTHYNVYTKGKTDLGRLLSNMSPMGINHPTYGQFRSLEAFWYYISTGERYEAFRNIYGYEAKIFSKDKEVVHRDDFREIFKGAMKLKVEQNPYLKRLFIESTLPFEHYYYYGRDRDVKPKIILLPRHQWMMDYWTELRAEY